MFNGEVNYKHVFSFTDDVTCFTSSMLILVNPYGTFSGVIYIQGYEGTPGCTFTGADLPVGKQGYALNLNETDCGSKTLDLVSDACVLCFVFISMLDVLVRSPGHTHLGYLGYLSTRTRKYFYIDCY